MMSFTTLRSLRAWKIKTPCEYRATLATRITDSVCSRDTCITTTYGDLKKIRYGIEELDFKP